MKHIPKLLNLLLAGVLFLFLPLYSDSNKNIYIGMTVPEFRKTLPSVLPKHIRFNKQLNQKETILNIKGSWSYLFSDDILQSVTFISEKIYMDPRDAFEKNKVIYETYVAASQKLVHTYIQQYGKPNEFLKTNIILKNKFREYYDTNFNRTVLKVKWNMYNADLIITCNLYCARYGEYLMMNSSHFLPHLIVSIRYKKSSHSDVIQKNKKSAFNLGMNVYEFQKKHPKLFPNVIKPEGQWSKTEKLYGLDGKWVYCFQRGKLNWFSYSYNIDTEESKESYEKCLSSTKKLINYYTKIYGKPQKYKVDDTLTYDDLLQSDHRSYITVVEAQWKTPNGNLEIYFKIYTIKGQRTFLVKLHFH